jgi:hypothetical protein
MTRLINDKKRIINALLVFYLALSPLTVNSVVKDETARPANLRAQQSYPPVPGDLTRIYYLDAGNNLVPIPFEPGITSLNVHAVAKDNITSDVELSGTGAATVLKQATPSFYVFVADRMDPPPHLLIRLTNRKKSRRFTITMTKGREGYAPLNEVNVKLDYRVLERLSVDAGEGRIIFVNYMEIHPRQRLEPGEYAIIGDSLADIATFRIE